jgi:hypothetical protein
MDSRTSTNNRKRTIGRRHLSKEGKTAYQSWADQRARCQNSKNQAYKYYGAKGISVLYGSTEFVNWWLNEMSVLNLKKPTISRIDHDGNYEFGNIKLEEHIDNCVWDTIKRNGAPGLHCKIKLVIFDYETMEPLMIASSGVEAAFLTDVKVSNVTSIAAQKPRGRMKITPRSGKGYTFCYLSDYPQWETLNESQA